MCTLRVKCVFCGLIIDCQRDDTAKLLAHLQNDHPEMAHYQPNATSPRSNQNNESSEDDDSSSGASIEHLSEREELLQRIRIASPNDGSCSSSVNSEEDAHHLPAHQDRPARGSFASKRSVLYQTSLSSWRLGGRPICCPNCGATQIPIVRSHANGVTWSSMVASCFLFSWPLCCLSWFLLQPTNEYLHCARCDQLLGEHDIKAEAIVPNYAILDRMED
uniref:LITAF domain-containing protein n=1 Tax=Anopheles farauti TaxID=69004 RepID=A0A499FUV3_9DIPT